MLARTMKWAELISRLTLNRDMNSVKQGAAVGSPELVMEHIKQRKKVQHETHYRDRKTIQVGRR